MKIYTKLSNMIKIPSKIKYFFIRNITYLKVYMFFKILFQYYLFYVEKLKKNIQIL